jgi:hypothetical protein
MQHPAEPTPCPDCSHLVYRPLVAPVKQPPQTCRAPGDGPDGRCGCESVVHRIPTLRPRHRMEAIGS